MKQLAIVMNNDSLAAVLAQGHDYKRSLAGDELDEDGNVVNAVDRVVTNSTNEFMDAISDFFQSLPWVVYVVLAIVAAAFLACLLYRRGVLGWGFSEQKVVAEDADDIYEIDIPGETDAALRAGDHAALVRLTYLSTLRRLDEVGRIEWRIHKTPTQFAREVRMKPFNDMTRHFLRVRYGKFPASRELYEQMLGWQEQVMKGGAS